MQGYWLVYQLAHAATVNAQLVTAGLAAANLTVVASPLTAEGLAHLTTQAQNGNVFFVHPADIATVSDRTCATMLVTAGPVVEVLAGEAASVVDTMIWPQTPGYLVSTRAAGDVPAFQDALPTADALMAFVRKYVGNHRLEDEFHAAAVEAAAIAGSTWIMTVDAPLAAINVPYQEQQPPHAFDTVFEVEEEDPRLAGDDAWPEHPQAAQGVRYYTPDGRPVLMRAVPLLPTMEVVTVLQVPDPGDVSVIQHLLGLIPHNASDRVLDSALLKRARAWNEVMITISGLISSRGVWGKVGRRGKVGSCVLNPNGATHSGGSGRN